MSNEKNFDIANVSPTDRDVAADLVPERAQTIDPAVEKRVIRKIDLYYIPLMWFGYGFTYYDKVSFSKMQRPQRRKATDN